MTANADRSTMQDAAVTVGGSLRLRWPWLSPPDQPRWARPCLLAIAAVAAVLYAWSISRSQYNGFFSMAVRSMTTSPKAFVFGAVDPAGSITIDKIPGFLWPQAVSALIFGFHPWALTLPEVIEGVVSVLVLYRVVRRWAGPVAGLLASAIFTLTPITAVMFGHTTMEDPALTMCLILAADAWQKAAGPGRLRWLLLAGMWVGAAFQAKMLQAWAVLPAFAVGYLLTAPVALRTRVRQVATAGMVTLAVSATWIVLAALTPTADRPYIDGTTNNSPVAMVVGYNGVNRFGDIHFPGALTGATAITSAAGPAQPPGGGTPEAGLSPQVQEMLASAITPQWGGWGKLFAPSLATQIGWLYPLAALGLIAGLACRRRPLPGDALLGGYLMWGTWLAVTGLAFSAGQVAHASYTAALAPPLAALAGAGLVDLWRLYRRGGRTAWLLPGAIAAEAAWTAWLTERRASFLPWALPMALILAVAAVSALLLARTRASTRIRLAVIGLVAGTAAMLLVPAAWSVSTLDSAYDGTEIEAHAGPSASSGLGPADQSVTLTEDQRQILGYATAHRDGAKYLFATDSWNTASPYILTTGASILPMGGFSGEVPFPTLSQLQHLIATGQLRFVLLSGGFSISSLFGSTKQATAVQGISSWVQKHCTSVPAATSQAQNSSQGYQAMSAGLLYACSPGH